MASVVPTPNSGRHSAFTHLDKNAILTSEKVPVVTLSSSENVAKVEHIEEVKAPFNAKCIPYKAHDESQAKCSGEAYIMNRISWNWRDLKQFTNLEQMLAKKRIQNRLFPEQLYKEPTLLKSTPRMQQNLSDADGVIQSKSILMATCLPCYDEEWCEMSGTLRSLAKNILVNRKRPDRSFELHVIVFILQDGWGKASATLKQGITAELGCPNEEWITNAMKGEKESIALFAPNAEVYYPNSMHDPGENSYSGATFYPIFVTKSRNAQKFNSHLIFFSLCHILKPNCVFLTDCGTVYNPDCLHKLVEFLCKKQSTVIGCTARQRVMGERTRRQVQEYPHWSPEYKGEYDVSIFARFWQQIYWWLCPAPLQGFEFESTFLLNTAMFNVMGALPVLPGPCQLLWWDHLESRDGKHGEGALDMYFRHLNMDVSRSGIVKTSTLLAEDRVLSFAMVLRTLGMSTVWVSGATFSYEPMVTWVQLLGQRRRWVNGTIAAYIFYLIDEKGQDEFAMSGLGDSRSLQSLWGLQLYQSFLQVLSPAFFCIAVYEAMLQTWIRYPFFSILSYKQFNPAEVVAVTYFLFYIFWVLLAFFLGKKPNFMNRNFYLSMMECVYWFCSFVNAIVSSFIMYNIFTSSTGATAAVGPVLYIMIIIWVIPFCLALLLSFSSAFLYLSYGIPFLIQLAMYVTFIPAFAFARMHDLSWGNRDSNAHGKGGADNKAKARKESDFYWFTVKANLCSVGSNAALVTVYITLIETYGHLGAIFIPLFLILFFPTIIQILFAAVFLFSMVFKSIMSKVRKYYARVQEINRSDGYSSVATSADWPLPHSPAAPISIKRSKDDKSSPAILKRNNSSIPTFSSSSNKNTLSSSSNGAYYTSSA